MGSERRKQQTVSEVKKLVGRSPVAEEDRHESASKWNGLQQVESIPEHTTAQTLNLAALWQRPRAAAIG